MSGSEQAKIAIVGAGFSGIAMAIELQNKGITDFVILEKADDVGGTWRENTYPGAECDIASALYSYSFENNPEWEYKWSGQKQILSYIKKTVEKYGLRQYMRFGLEVVNARFDKAQARWSVDCKSRANGGDAHFDVQHVIFAIGQLHHPFTPNIEGAEDYQGQCFHSAKWDHDVKLEGKRVAVIGAAASAVQFIPEIAPKVEQLDVYQRSANWIFPKLDRPYTKFEQWLSEHIPFVSKFYRFKLWIRNEMLFHTVMKGKKWAQKLGRRTTLKFLEQEVSDPEKRKKLTPDYPVGAKRILFTDNYYAAINRDNVDLITDPIEGFTENGLRTANESRDYDVVIYGTGFKTNPFLSPMHIENHEGKALRDKWSEGAHAYLGITVSDFPNLFMMYGPNTNLGHNSIVIMSEAQSRYITQCILTLDKKGAKVVEVDAKEEAKFNEETQARLQESVWSQIEKSWYKDGNRITNNWSGSTWEYIRRTRRFDEERYHLS